MCSNEDVVEDLTNGLPKVHILVLEMMLMHGFCLAEILADGPRDTNAVDAFALTSHW